MPALSVDVAGEVGSLGLDADFGEREEILVEISAKARDKNRGVRCELE